MTKRREKTNNMEAEDLQKNIEKLEIESQLLQIRLKDDALPLTLNPFMSKCGSGCEKPTETHRKRFQLFGRRKKCKCHDSKATSRPHILDKTKFKTRKKKSLLKEPVLKDVARCVCVKGASETEISEELQKHLSLQVSSSNDDLLHLDSFRTLALENVQVSSSASQSDDEIYTRQSFKNFRSTSRNRRKLMSRKSEPPLAPAALESNGNPAGTCSMQARLNECDVTINEIASYLEYSLNLPKKMSSMAELMYM